MQEEPVPSSSSAPPPPPSLRIAILECDTPAPGTQERYGGYGGVFSALLRASSAHLLLPETALRLTYHAVVPDEAAYPALEDIDGVLLTGSKHDSFADVPWINRLVDFVATLLAQDRVRVMGVCFGHQIVGRAMGVRVGRSDRGWEASVCEVELTARGQEVFGRPRLAIHQMHRDIVYACPEGVERLGHSPRCEIQGMYVPRRLITVQGHPEFDEAIVRELLEIRHGQGIFDRGTYEDGMARVANAQDGVVVGAAFLRFMMEGR